MKSNPKKSNPERQGRPIIKRKPTGFFNFNQATGFVLQNKGEILMKISRGQTNANDAIPTNRQFLSDFV